MHTMKLAVFCYDFAHYKSSEGLLWLKAHGYDDVTCFASPYKQLFVPKSKTRITPIILPLSPEKIADAFAYGYIPVDHDDPDMPNKIKDYNYGIILGARILKPHVVTALPIINMHPGVLPENRGLDNIKHAILNDLPQAVTVHIIDRHIDKGLLLRKKLVDVYKDDTLLDIFMRVQNVELIQMIKMLDLLKRWRPDIGEPLIDGHYNEVITDADDAKVLAKFDDYKANYTKIVEAYNAR